ncbi:hypothetical protein HUZ36_02975 [Pseudoalteromonas sp. McH1-7]|uniref:hypothetical protein n=1 Tax=Pseudoalteromonas TaxID=53246 RepID=UPI000F654350|nr:MULTISPECIES: hypothetical protein [Pseudoalteromonas]NLR13423.1 hypothetical protein [Pseudoalteromonas peptidolytica]NUZ09738.1 hypothetical protein [Pseudoalteromonas sp. McH1-7]RRS10194.1 hypothetical protein EAG18_02990 [Pseudoalteromonas sp. J010]USD27787.1 hypothetical protein J8Z24_12680 [Pseudoalteromonas sp. SCSIO 43201]GEK10160.1 hypothetical protein PPE03_24090 [Pseudoalteromonas peptidolytica]
MTIKMMLATVFTAVFISGCSGNFTTKVSNVPVDCDSDSRSCAQRCHQDYSDPMQVQACQDRCFVQQNQCNVDRPNEDTWEISSENPTYPVSF